MFFCDKFSSLHFQFSFSYIKNVFNARTENKTVAMFIALKIFNFYLVPFVVAIKNILNPVFLLSHTTVHDYQFATKKLKHLKLLGQRSKFMSGLHKTNRFCDKCSSLNVQFSVSHIKYVWNASTVRDTICSQIF